LLVIGVVVDRLVRYLWQTTLHAQQSCSKESNWFVSETEIVVYPIEETPHIVFSNPDWLIYVYLYIYIYIYIYTCFKKTFFKFKWEK